MVGVCGVSGVTASPGVLPWVATIVLVIVSQFAAAGAIIHVAIRQFVAPAMRPRQPRRPVAEPRRDLMRPGFQPRRGALAGLARDAAHDVPIGAAFGLLLTSGLIASDLDQWRRLADSSEPLTALAALVAVIVAQAAVVGGLGGLVIRKLSVPGPARFLAPALRSLGGMKTAHLADDRPFLSRHRLHRQPRVDDQRHLGEPALGLGCF